MKWLVVQEADGAWENIKLDQVESISFDGKGGVWVSRRGAPPKGVTRPRALFLAEAPAVTAPVEDDAAEAEAEARAAAE
jgi:hypothetical protein